MNVQKIRNKIIITFIYRILGLTLIAGAFFLLLSIVLFFLNFLNPNLVPFFPIVDIPVNINLPGILELKNSTLHNVIIDDAFISFNLNTKYGLPGLFNFLHFFLMLAISYYIIYLLWKIFRCIKQSLQNENPFHKNNIIRIRIIALLVFISAILELAYPMVLKYFWLKNITINNQTFDFRLSFESVVDLLWVLVILVIAEIYRIGSEIKKEQELTI
jgi:hypothetical protein